MLHPVTSLAAGPDRVGWDALLPRDARRRLAAFFRDTRVILHESRFSLLLFAGVIFLGGAAIRLAHPDHDLTYLRSVYYAFLMILGESPLPFPDASPLAALFFAIPLLGLLAIGDGLVRFGVALFNRANRMEAWQKAMAGTHREHIVLAGLGKVGYRVWQELTRLGEEVVAIEMSDSHLVRLVRDAKGCVLKGDVRHREILEQAGIERAKAVIAATNDDLVNLDVALAAREKNPGIRAVVRIFDQDLAHKVEKNFDVIAFSTSSLAAPAFAYAAAEANIVHTFFLGETRLSVAQLVLSPNGELAGRAVGEIEKRFDASILALRPAAGGTVDFHPDDAVRLAPGDHVAVLADGETLARVERANRTGGRP